MKKTLVAMLLMAGSTFAQYPNSADANAGGPGYDPSAGAYSAPGPDPYSTGPSAGAPESYPAADAYAAPAACGPGYVWIDGYNDANGYCAVPPFSGAYWVAPGFFGGRYIAGYWGRGGLGYAPSFGFRGGYGANYGVRGGFRAPAAAPGFHSQGGFRGGGPVMRGGGSSHGGRR